MAPLTFGIAKWRFKTMEILILVFVKDRHLLDKAIVSIVSGFIVYYGRIIRMVL